MILPDVNLLIYTYDTTSPFHTKARFWWEELLNGSEPIGIPWEVSLGFLRLVTHPKVFANPLPISQALVIVSSWYEEAVVETISAGTRHLVRLANCLNEVGVGNKLVADAHLAAIAMEYRAVIHTNDRDFERFSGLKITNPLI